MKKNISILSYLGGVAIIIAGAMIMFSCEGPMGPAGADGSDGADGADGADGIDGIAGTDGTDGVAGNAVCLECHTTAVKDAVTDQYESTIHHISGMMYNGQTVYEYAGGRIDCAKCHSHEGFVETVWTGLDTVAAVIPLPQGVRCQTCHDFHSSLDFENEPNSAIRETMPVPLIAEDGMVTVEFDNAESNLCMHCHQARTPAPDDTDGSVAVNVSSTHWGAHHGPVANLLNGIGGYEYGDDLSTTGPHASGADCISCHMHESAVDTLGGHTWMPGEEACTGCHSAGIPDSDIETKLHTLQAALISAEILDAEGGINTGYYQADSAGALWNFLLVEEDRSMGIHNPDYAEALLDASIAFLSGTK